MSLKLLANPVDPPIGALIAVELVLSESKATIETSLVDNLKSSNNVQLLGSDGSVLCDSNNEVGRYLARTVAPELYGSSDINERTQVDHWLSFSIGPLKAQKSTDASLLYLDKVLKPLTWLVAKHLTLADIYVFSALVDHRPLETDGKYSNISRWYKQMLSLPAVQKVLASIPKNRVAGSNKATKSAGRQEGNDAKRPCGTGNRKQEGKFFELPGAEMGKVVVRFPPEASGFLHIGHAKAALLNQYYAEAFEGQLIMRFDDTNPAKENVEFEQAILEDLEMLQIKPDRFTHSSDYFDLMLSYCDKLIMQGKAFVDDTPALTMKEQREQRLPSANRDNTVEKNIQMWEEMKKGTARGQECCVRAKIDYQSTNGCMRDPTIYRCKPEPHPRTGLKYKVYPTYDFACPIVDAVEGVTHTLRTTEYHDRDVQFYWLIEALNLRRPYIWEYSRLNMTNTVLSKRRLTWLVAEGFVDGWDDPRFPTVRGILRRGMTVDGLKQFIIAQGSSRSVVFMEWDKIWSFNKKVIDPIAIRYTALNDGETVPVHVENATDGFITVQNHPKDIAKGTKQVRIGPNLIIERCDAETLVEGQNATFINWGNLLIVKVTKNNGAITNVTAKLNLDNKDYKNTVKLTWLAVEKKDEPDMGLLPCYAVYFEHIISKAVLGKDEDFKDFVAKDTRREVKLLGESELKRVKKGEIIQLQRKGFFRCDVPYAAPSPFSARAQPVVLFHIPDGRSDSTGQTPASVSATAETTKNKKDANNEKDTTLGAQALSSRIQEQGDKVRQLKTDKADKKAIEEQVKVLIALKAEYKSATGKDWKTGDVPQAAPQTNAGGLSKKVQAQADKVRQLKTEKADKKIVEEAVKDLLAYKAEYKNATGKDWKPEVIPQTPAAPEVEKIDAQTLWNKVQAQGDKVRKLKTEKADKKIVDEAVKDLLAFKAEYKNATGTDWKPDAIPQNPTASQVEKIDAQTLWNKVQAQGDKVRQLKSAKADKKSVEEAVKDLLAFKAEYKSATGKDWKPEAIPQTPAAPQAEKIDAQTLSNKVQAQGDKVRKLKTEKADKKIVEEAVKDLLAFKAEYKNATGKDWKPEVIPQTPAASQVEKIDAQTLSNKIQAQGDQVRQLKSAKADKKSIDEAVKALLTLKAEYKSATGEDWKPSSDPKTASLSVASSKMCNDTTESITAEISQRSEKIRELKSQLDDEEQILSKLKANYKTLTGQEWNPSGPISAPAVDQASKGNQLLNEITKQGDTIRQLKSDKAQKLVIEEAVKTLLNLKEQYKVVTGEDWKPPGGDARKPKSAPAEKPARKEKSAKNQQLASKDADDSNKTGTRLCIEVKKNENLSEWFAQVITKGEMIDYYDVSGCYVLRPWSMEIWEVIVDYIKIEIKKKNVRSAYFPIFVSKGALEREKNHIADFAPEVAWVTKSGESELAEPIAIRPTSETVMYPAYAKWLKSHRDLPLKINQWNNVVRWEFKHPMPFLRTREFLWQEGHTAFATKPEADAEVLEILDMYARVYEDLLAVPVVKGRKTEKEKFAGADYTTTVEAFISATGRAIQGATSHHLGQNFAKMFGIQVAGVEKGDEKTFVYQNSWGLTTRTLGVMIMVHGDDKGLVLPPKIASIQAIIVPCGITATTTVEQRDHLAAECTKLEAELAKDGAIRIQGDYSDHYSPGWKFNHWEIMGVPVRVELGFKDLEKKQVTLVRRDTSARINVNRSEVFSAVSKLLDDIQKALLNKATVELKEHIKETTEWKNFCTQLDKKNLILAPFCGEISCEERIKADSTRQDAAEEPGAPAMGAKSLCIPFDQPKTSLASLKCVHPECSKPPKFYTLFGRSY